MEEKSLGRVHLLRSMPYSDYLQTPEWAEKRQLALARDGYRCRVCNEREHLHVHHRTYIRRGNEDLDDLTTLCESCHDHFHKKFNQQDLMERTYTPPRVEKTPEEKRIVGEEYLVGMLLCTPGLHVYVCGILMEDDFVGENTRALYQIMGKVYQANQSMDLAISESLRSYASTIANRVMEGVPGMPADPTRQVRVAVEAATRVKRNCLLQQNTDLQTQIRAAAEAGDGETRRHLQIRLQSVHQQLHTIHAATQIMG